MGWIGVDLDMTLATYDGWVSATYIGAPIPAMVERVKNWLAAGREVKIFTARASGPAAAEAVAAIQAWCVEHIGVILPVTNVKDYHMEELWDDRAVQVQPNTGEPVYAPTRISHGAADNSGGPIIFESGAASSKVPRFDLIWYRALARVAKRFQAGLEAHGEGSCNALGSKGPLTDRKFILARATHAIDHALKFIGKTVGYLEEDGDDDAGAIAWAGLFLCEVMEEAKATGKSLREESCSRK